jgi:EmrB/QacA subfamily drug resistance transporter
VTQTAVGFRSERGPVLIAIMLANFLVAIDATILATAVPSIVEDLGSFEAFPWLFTTYLLAQAVTVPVYSKLVDMVGRKPILLLGIAVFLLGSILCALAPNMLLLIVFRAVQGLGAGAITPAVLTIPGDIYSVEERARVQGYLSSVWAVAAVLGPTVGGLFAQFIDWRWIFIVNIPLCLLAGWLIVRNFHERFERREHRIDVAGAVLLTVALTLLLLGVLEGGVAWAWNAPISLGIFAAAAVLLLIFVLVERRAVEPVLPVGVLTRRVVLAACLTSAFVGVALTGLNLYVPTYLQRGLEVTPLVAGLTLAALAVGWPIASTISGRIYMRIGFRRTGLIGATLSTVVVVVFTLTSGAPHLAVAAVACFILGIGMGLLFTPMLVAAQSSVAWNERGVVTGAITFLRNVGSAVGAAVCGSIANAVIASRGGDETDPGTIVPASTAVFLVVTIALAITLITAALLPGRSSGRLAPSTTH